MKDSEDTKDMHLKTGWLAGLALAGATVGLMLGGCSASSFIPEAKADPTRFFVLSAPTIGGVAERAADAPTVRLRKVEVASYIQSRPLIVRRGDNELEFRDFARWGEPLEQGIARVLREELLARGAGDVTLSTGRGAATEADFELLVRVLACEGEADGGVNFRAVWELTRVATGTGGQPSAEAVQPARGDYRANGMRWDGRNEATLAARLSDAVSGLAAEIAGGLKR